MAAEEGPAGDPGAWGAAQGPRAEIATCLLCPGPRWARPYPGRVPLRARELWVPEIITCIFCPSVSSSVRGNDVTCCEEQGLLGVKGPEECPCLTSVIQVQWPPSLCHRAIYHSVVVSMVN